MASACETAQFLCLTISRCVHMGVKATQQLHEFKKAAPSFRLTFVADVALVTWEFPCHRLGFRCARLSRSSEATRRRKFRWRTSSRRRWLPATSASILSLGLPTATSAWGWRSWAALYQVTDLPGHIFSGFKGFSFSKFTVFSPAIFLLKREIALHY